MYVKESMNFMDMLVIKNIHVKFKERVSTNKSEIQIGQIYIYYGNFQFSNMEKT